MASAGTAAKARWTVLVYLNGDNDLEPFALRDFHQMARVGSTPEVHVVTQFDRSGRFAATAPQWGRALRFRVEKGMEPRPENALADLGEQNMADGAVLADFVRWGQEAFPAERYALVIWDHGPNWRLAESHPVRGTVEEIRAYAAFRRRAGHQEAGRRAGRHGAASAATAGAVVPALPALRTVAGGLRYVSLDETSGDRLFIREVQDCLAGTRLDLIGFDACLMATLETAYAMRGVAGVLVASEELEAGDGWDYADWLRRLTDDPDMNAPALGAALVASYRAAYQDADPARTLSAVDLDRAESLAVAIDALADALAARCDVAPGEIADARRACAPFAPGYGLHSVDLAHFCDEVAAATADARLRDLASALAMRVRECVIANFAGSERRGPFGASGLAVYFPETRALFHTDPDRAGYSEGDADGSVEFARRHRWGAFLRAYYARVP
jgi:Clostripain family.